MLSTRPNSAAGSVHQGGKAKYNDAVSRLVLVGALVLLLLCGGCGGGEATKPGAEAPKTAAAKAAGPPKEHTGREAFQNMFVAARSWARDARPFRLTNLHLPSSTGVGGRAATWTAAFASRSLGKYRTFTYSTVAAGSIRQGLFSLHDERYGAESELAGPPFEVAGFKSDSDKAWEAAEGQGGKSFRAKNPQAPVTFLLEYTRSYQRIVWRVCYDSQCSTSPFTVNVDATTGEVLKVAR